MGIAKGAARLLLDEHFHRPFHGSVLQLGRQHIWFSMDDLQRWAAMHGVSLYNVDSVSKSNIDFLREMNCIDDISFFSAMGFQTVESCDASNFEGATHTIDLNHSVPESLHNQYDVVFDGGTIEHIFHLPQVYRNIYDMLKVGGRIIHSSPSTNHVDHGFYMFSPTLFYDYYTANNWEIVTSYIFKYTERHYKDPWKIYSYKPGSIEPLSFKDSLLGIFFIAIKTGNSTADIIPQQGYYQRVWRDTMTGSSPSEGGSVLVTKIGQFLKKTPILYEIALRVYKKLKPRRMPPLVKKY